MWFEMARHRGFSRLSEIKIEFLNHFSINKTISENEINVIFIPVRNSVIKMTLCQELG